MTQGELAHELILQIIRTRRAYRQAVQRKLREHNIEMTFEMLQVIYRLWQQEGVSQQRLAELTSKDKASLTNLVNNLTRRGWVTRRADAADGRSRLVHLTPVGAALAGIVKPLLQEIYEYAGEGLYEQQMQTTIGTLEDLTESFNEI